jgi:hypothetical protein
MKFYLLILLFHVSSIILVCLLNQQAYAFRPAIFKRRRSFASLWTLNFSSCSLYAFASSDSLDKAKAEQEKKVKVHNEVKLRLRLKIARMEAIRRGRKAYARWFNKQRVIEETKMINVIDEIKNKNESVTVNSFFTMGLWPIKLCCSYWGLLP